MNTQNIHHELIGTVPVLNEFHKDIPQMIAEYKATKPPKVEFDLMSDTERAEYFAEEMKKPKVWRRIQLGMILELCGAHFYGLKSLDFGCMSDFIDEIEAIEDELKFI